MSGIKKNLAVEPGTQIKVTFEHLKSMKALGLKGLGCILGISPDNELFYGQRLRAILEAVKDNGFKQCRIVVGDTLQRFNFQRRSYTAEESYEKSAALYDTWLNGRFQQFHQDDEVQFVSNQEIISSVFDGSKINVVIERWDDYIKSQSLSLTELPFSASSESTEASTETPFERMRALVEVTFQQDPVFQDRVKRAAGAIVDSAKGQHKKSKLNVDQEREFVVNYIKEELAVFALWGQRYPHSVFPYPTAKAAHIILRIQDCFRKFKKFNPDENIRLHMDNLTISQFKPRAQLRQQKLRNNSAQKQRHLSLPVCGTSSFDQLAVRATLSETGAGSVSSVIGYSLSAIEPGGQSSPDSLLLSSRPDISYSYMSPMESPLPSPRVSELRKSDEDFLADSSDSDGNLSRSCSPACSISSSPPTGAPAGSPLVLYQCEATTNVDSSGNRGRSDSTYTRSSPPILIIEQLSEASSSTASSLPTVTQLTHESVISTSLPEPIPAQRHWGKGDSGAPVLFNISEAREGIMARIVAKADTDPTHALQMLSVYTLIDAKLQGLELKESSVDNLSPRMKSI